MNARGGTAGTTALRLGLDLGSMNVRLALLGPEGAARPRWLGEQPIQGRLLEALEALLVELRLADGQALEVRATGVGAHVLGEALGLPVVNEIVGLAEAARALAPDARAVLEIGGHASRFVALGANGEVADYALSEPCAAGTGAFLEQQASRLRLDPVELSRIAEQARRGAPVAGRCSVFAKSDMIHLQQKGVPVEEIAYGLCLAVARTVLSTVLRGRDLPLPAVLVGGAALSGGLLRALHEVTGLAPDALRVPERAASFAALGAALTEPRTAALTQPLPLGELVGRVRGAREQAARARPSVLARLVSPRVGVASEPRHTRDGQTVHAFLGVDVGSVSTNLVVLDGDRVIDGIYLATRGRPVEVLREGLALLRERFGDALHVRALGTTGSGRHLAAGLLGADTVENEISCQLKSAQHVFPDVDTVIEIGGQDSKFIRAQGGRLVDFAMNKICAAGTGSFIEEEALRLGVSVEGEFADLALAAPGPANLGCRCTVFMDTEVVNALAQGRQTADLCAGLAHSIARNYVERVVERRPIGEHVVLQGGVACNHAVVAAFAALLGRPVQVHPHCRISGAIGAALYARAAFEARPGPSAFRGLEALEPRGDDGSPTVQTFECPQCENRCQVSRISIAEGAAPVRAHFGDACERYSARDRRRSEEEVPDLIAEREAAVEQALQAARPSGTPRGRIGIPRASVLLDELALWGTLLGELGFEVVLSRPTSARTLVDGLARLPAETCLPIKLAFGHVHELWQRGVDAVFVPSLLDLPDPPYREGILCPYSNTLPHLLSAGMPGPLLAPELSLSRGGRASLEPALARALARFGVKPRELRAALKSALALQRGLALRCRARGAELLEEERLEVRVALLGRPYHLADPFLSMNLPRHLRRLGVLALPLYSLPVTDEGWELGTVPWSYCRTMLRAARWTRTQPRLYPVLVTSFGCGPDAFVGKHLPELLGETPFLQLEFDEHRAEAGLITRLEAFLDEIAQHERRAGPPRPSPTLARSVPKERAHYVGRRVFVPYISEHSVAFSGAFRFIGLDARVLPPPDEELMARAEALGSGKECHPYALLAADLERLIAHHRPGDLFYIPGSVLPCLIQQYHKAMGLMLAERGVTDLELLSPIMRDMRRLLGLGGYTRLFLGLFAADLLVRASCAVRPYEREAGLTDALHARNLVDLERALAGEEEIGGALERCAERLASVETDRRAGRPLVGVAGDIYTRVNPAANRGLFHELERAGCEVWPAPFLVDLAEYGLVEGLSEALEYREPSEIVYQGLLLCAQQAIATFVRRGLGSPRPLVNVLGRSREGVALSGAWREEAPYWLSQALSRPYVGDQTNELVRYNVGKMVDFARRGADGVLNVVAQNCMVGTVSAAVARRIRADHDEIPIVTLWYGATESDALRTALGAFVHQVFRRWARP